MEYPFIWLMMVGDIKASGLQGNYGAFSTIGSRVIAQLLPPGIFSYSGLEHSNSNSITA